jgi:hypothetical protein
LRATYFISIFCERTLIPLAGICNKTNILLGGYPKMFDIDIPQGALAANAYS